MAGWVVEDLVAASSEALGEAEMVEGAMAEGVTLGEGLQAAAHAKMSS